MGLIETLQNNRVYFDTNIVIYAVEGIEPYNTALGELFRAVSSGELRAVTSELTLAESLVKPFRDGSTERRMAYERFLRSRGNFEVHRMDREILIEAARMRALSGLKLPDAIHVATALHASCHFFLTNDRRIDLGLDLHVAYLSDYVGR
jgi:predicted nucleic acid-binding protein